MVNYGFTLVYTFNERLKEKLAEKKIRPAELARRSGVTKQNIGRLINNTPHSESGALPRAEKDTVIKLAKALDWDLDDALMAADIAPINKTTDDGLYKGLNELPPDRQELARRQIRAIIESLSVKEQDTDYIDDEE
jgi:transcriptional regulator with XRE-family HTH domain